MKFEKSNGYLIIFFATVLGFIIHKIIAYFLIPKEFEDHFIYSILMVYGIFGTLSLVIVYFLKKIKKSAPNSVGYGFLALTTVKMVIAYVFLRPIIKTHLPKTPTEKLCFFIVFIYFLAIETYLTIRILNNKQ
ncbi:MAG: hypothetical protein EBS55_11670 [Flavobacteriaceae bacterium]|nr:hypothetical protein [Flavobacteriaceae bacterium]